MSEIVLGRLERVELGTVWTHEAHDFTPWLACEENLQILAETIGIELELEATEKNVGPFKADILCKDTITGAWVLIENQLKDTDHKHLGQLLTYAAGLKAVTIVWISAHFTEEHRAALDWLNEITDERFNFFGLEIELYSIGGSLAAPRLNVVSKPNDWSRFVKSGAGEIAGETFSELKAQHLRYWERMTQLLRTKGFDFGAKAPKPKYYMNFAIGRVGFRLSASVNTLQQFIRTGIYIYAKEAKSYFSELETARSEIESEFGEPLEWELLPNQIGSRIAVYKRDVDPTDEIDWPNQHEWLADKLVHLDGVFRRRVKNLDLGASTLKGESPEDDDDAAQEFP